MMAMVGILVKTVIIEVVMMVVVEMVLLEIVMSVIRDTVTADGVSVGDNDINGTGDEMCAVGVDTRQQC